MKFLMVLFLFVGSVSFAQSGEGKHSGGGDIAEYDVFKALQNVRDYLAKNPESTGSKERSLKLVYLSQNTKLQLVSSSFHTHTLTNVDKILRGEGKLFYLGRDNQIVADRDEVLMVESKDMRVFYEQLIFALDRLTGVETENLKLTAGEEPNTFKIEVVKPE